MRNLGEHMRLASIAAQKQWGREAQLDMVVEEGLELALAVMHYRRGRKTRADVIDELADDYITRRHLRVALNITDDEVAQALRRKLDRLDKRIELARAGIKVCQIQPSVDAFGWDCLTHKTFVAGRPDKTQPQVCTAVHAAPQVPL